MSIFCPVIFFLFSFLLFYFVPRWHTHIHARVWTQYENFNSVYRGRNQSHISLVNPQWLSTDPDTNKVLSRWGQGLRTRTEWEERPAVWGPTNGWHCSSAIMVLVYGREGCRKEAAEMGEREAQRKNKKEGVGEKLIPSVVWWLIKATLEQPKDERLGWAPGGTALITHTEWMVS